MFQSLPIYGGDPILGLIEVFRNDARPRKVNLSVGIYQDDQGAVPLLEVVRLAEAEIAASPQPRPYLPISGSLVYRSTVQNLVFGPDSPAIAERRAATVQTVGGGSALRVGANFIKRHFPASEVWISDPSWENHRVVFEAAGFQVHTYPYLERTTGEILFEAMLETLERAPSQSLVLVQPCCHNPTGADLGPEQWSRLIELFARRGLLPFIDMAYQGFGQSLEADAAPIRALAEAGIEFLVATSFSKNLALYGERVGSLSVISADAKSSRLVARQIELDVRADYSNPPAHGARIVEMVLSDPGLRAGWEAELDGMRERVIAMRRGLHDALAVRAPGRPDRLLNQSGMFSYTGLTPVQVDRLREEFGVYLVNTGRMCVAALQADDIDYVADAITAVTA